MPHYQCEVDTVDKRAWHALVERLTDANVCQAWSVGAARKGEKNLSHLLLKRVGEIDFFWAFYPDLPDALTPRIFVCEERGNAVAAIVISHLGDRAMYLFGATSNRGTTLGASHIVHWEGLIGLHRQNCRWYDLEGDSSRGVQQFKAGLTGKSGSEIHMGDFDACGSAPSRLIVQVGVGLKNRYRDGRRLLSARESVPQ